MLVGLLSHWYDTQRLLHDPARAREARGGSGRGGGRARAAQRLPLATAVGPLLRDHARHVGLQRRRRGRASRSRSIGCSRARAATASTSAASGTRTRSTGCGRATSLVRWWATPLSSATVGSRRRSRRTRSGSTTTSTRLLGAVVGTTKDAQGTLVWAADEVVYAPAIAVTRRARGRDRRLHGGTGLMANPDVAKLESIAREGRVQIIRMLTHAGSGHPGGSLSVIDILTDPLLQPPAPTIPSVPQWEDRDRFVLSKGHCVPAQYYCMAKAGYFPMDRAHHPAQARQPAPGPPRSRDAARHRGRDRLARPGPVGGGGHGARAQARGQGRARLLRAGRRRDPGGPGVGEPRCRRRSSARPTTTSTTSA